MRARFLILFMRARILIQKNIDLHIISLIMIGSYERTQTMKKTFTGIYIKPRIGIRELSKYGFRQDENSSSSFLWKPSFTCEDYEKKYYLEGDEYLVYINSDRQIVIFPNQWIRLSGKIQTLLFDMITDGIVEKKVLLMEGAYE